MILEDYLALNAQRHGEKMAVADGMVRYSYTELYQHVLEKKREYLERCGHAIPFRIKQDVESLVTYFAIHLAGCVAVPLAKDYPEDAFRQLCEELDKETFSHDVADILFTTGTTGSSKGVMISHDTLLADAENLVEAQGFCPDLTFIICGPLNHIGSLSKIYPSLMVGASIHILEGMKDMNAFFETVERSTTKVASFMVPVTLKMVMTLDSKRLHALASKFDFIETGAAAMAECDMIRLTKLLPETRLYNTYASTETGIIATHNYNSDACYAGCLGRAMKNSRMEISDEGKVVCYGRTIMLGYWNDKALTESVLYGGAVHTNDLACFDEQGRLRLIGRDDDTINIGGYKVAPTEVEELVLSMNGVTDCVCIEVKHPILGNILKLLIVPTNSNSPISFKQIATFLRTKLEGYKVPQQYEYVDKIERTFNGKINRKAYRF